MKLSKEELKMKINDLGIDDELKISLLEDVEDSMDISDDSEKVEKSAYDEVVAKYEEIKTKYKERFLKGEDTKDEDEKDEDEIDEKEVIDVKEI
ncbi:MAG: hypothetical protein U0K92_07640 [Treponema sp.]|nr:hypothetical protein [Treponema sp.]